MPKVVVLNQEGKELCELELNPAVFGIEPNQQAMFDAVVMQQASQRQGTHKVKNRREVAGGGRKPWRQKGTGRARQGSTRSPQWRGGGIVFGPTPRSYAYSLNRKVRRLALKSVLTEKVLENEFVVVDALNFPNIKTKDFVKVCDALNCGKKTLFVVSNDEDYTNAYLSARNLPNVLVLTNDKINVFDLMNANRVVATETAVKNVEEALG